MRDELVKLLKGAKYPLFEGYPAEVELGVQHSNLAFEHIADHLLANGVIVSPVEVGQTVYHIASCKDFRHELDGSLYDGNGGPGDATGYYCPCELRDNCPFDEEEPFECDEQKEKKTIFEDEVKGIMIGECDYDNVVFLGYSGNVYFHEFGKTVFLKKEDADRALKGDRNG